MQIETLTELFFTHDFKPCLSSLSTRPTIIFQSYLAMCVLQAFFRVNALNSVLDFPMNSKNRFPFSDQLSSSSCYFLFRTFFTTSVILVSQKSTSEIARPWRPFQLNHKLVQSYKSGSSFWVRSWYIKFYYTTCCVWNFIAIRILYKLQDFPTLSSWHRHNLQKKMEKVSVGLT